MFVERMSSSSFIKDDVASFLACFAERTASESLLPSVNTKPLSIEFKSLSINDLIVDVIYPGVVSVAENSATSPLWKAFLRSMSHLLAMLSSIRPYFLKKPLTLFTMPLGLVSSYILN